MSPFHAAALGYAARQISVFALDERDKRPVLRRNVVRRMVDFPEGTPDEQIKFRWRQLATVDAQVLAKWWAVNPRFNVAIATGPTAGFWVFDIDGEEGAATLAALEAMHGALPATPEQLTGKGRHICFAWDPDRPVRNRAGMQKREIGKGLDVRGDGGYIAAAPSVHPSGRVYAWREGRSLDDLPLAAAPDWLLDIVVPPVSEQARPVMRPREIREGKATRYGEAALENACRAISAATTGGRDETLWVRSCSIGRLVAGGEIDSGYAADALMHAGRTHVPAAYTEAALADKVERAFLWATDFPARAPERSSGPRAAGPARQAPAASPGATAIARRDVRDLWEGGKSAWVKPAVEWFAARGMEAAPPGFSEALATLRAHPAAPWGDGTAGAALLAPMRRTPDGPIEALAVLPLHPGARRFTNFVGDGAGCVAFLNGRPAGQLVVAMDLQDAWWMAAHRDRYCPGAMPQIVVAPRLGTFAGGALGDRWGRVDRACPRADPDAPPWRVGGMADVWLVVQHGLRGPPMKVRSFAGGTHQVRLEGDEAAAFYGGLAQQHWTTTADGFVPANRVRLVASSRQ